MKVTRGIASGIAVFLLTALALADEPTQTLDEALQTALLPGTTVVPGDTDENDFYIATEGDAAKIIENQLLAKEEAEAKLIAAKHAEEYKKVQLNPKTLTALNVDMRKIVNKYAAYEAKATLMKGDEKISTQAFVPTAAASAQLTKQPMPPLKKAASHYPLEPVLTAVPKKTETPVKNIVVAPPAPIAVLSHPLEPVSTAVPKKESRMRATKLAYHADSKQTRLSPQPAIHKLSPSKTSVATNEKHKKKLVVGVIKPYIPEKPIARKSLITAKTKSNRVSANSHKFAIKTLSYDRHRRLKLETLSNDAKKVTSNAGTKTRSRHHFKVIHLYR